MTLTELLDDGAGFDAEYAGSLSNHRPMALLALARLGATDARLTAFAQAYSKRLQPAPPPARWPAGDAWASRLGQGDAWPAYRDLFLHWLLTEDAGAVLRQVLPRLMQGCGAAAFHGLIRTAYALQSGLGQELADALAYWACSWVELGPLQAAGAVDDAEAVLRQLRTLHSAANLISQRMVAAAAIPQFQATVARLRVGDSTLPQLAALAAKAHAATGNFTALHLVTSAHAVRLLMPFLDEPVLALQAYWCAFAAAVCAAGLQARALPLPQPWPLLVAAALQSDDDHLIKLVDSCREEHRAYDADGADGDLGLPCGASIWQQAATRAVIDAGLSRVA